MKGSYFKVLSCRFFAGNSSDKVYNSEAVVKVYVNDRKGKFITIHEAHEGDFVLAPFNALKKALLPCFPKLEKVFLEEYSIEKASLYAPINIKITFSDQTFSVKGKKWDELGASTDMTAAIMEAIEKAFKKKLGL